MRVYFRIVIPWVLGGAQKDKDGQALKFPSALTELLYLVDHYLKEFDAKIVAMPDANSIVLDRTALYPRGGGQPSDRGSMTFKDESRLDVIESSKKENDIVVHSLAAPINRELIGRQVHVAVDWKLRYVHMRHHTALHIL
ncbi:MAG: alanine--tRNA ligase-related protein, partial [Rhabdochlamydiaceae bacterium]